VVEHVRAFRGLIHPHTLAYLSNIPLLLRYNLPGVFAANSYPSSFNGSLWSLPIEFDCYLLVPVIAVGKTRIPPLAMAASCLLLYGISLWYLSCTEDRRLSFGHRSWTSDFYHAIVHGRLAPLPPPWQNSTAAGSSGCYGTWAYTALQHFAPNFPIDQITRISSLAWLWPSIGPAHLISRRLAELEISLMVCTSTHFRC